MTRMRDRFFAGFGAMLLLVTGSALAIAVIVNGISNHNNSTKDASTSTSTAKASTTSCDSTSTTAPAETLPEIYKPTADVTSLEKTDLQTGSGTAAKSGSCLNVKYYGTLANGTVFDENYDKTTGFQFKLGDGQVIKGWDQGLVGVQVGGVRRLVIPADLAYGNQAQGAIPANAVLVFVVKVVSVK